MNPNQNLSRRSFITKAGTSLACASAAMAMPNPLLASSLAKAASPLKKNWSIQFSMYLYTLMNAPLPMEQLDIVEICRRTRELGIEGLDFIGSGYNRSWKEIRKIADDHGLKTICYTRGIGSLESPDAAVRASGIEEFKERLETAHTLGTNRIMLNQGGKLTGNDTDTNRKWMIEALKTAMPLAKAAGIEVTIETHNSTTAPFRNSSHFTEAIAELPDLKVCFDTGNSFKNGEDPLQGYLNNKEQVTHMHFKDFADGKLGKASNLCPPGKGLIDLPAIIAAMKESGYRGYINLEKGGPDGFEVYKESMEILRSHIS